MTCLGKTAGTILLETRIPPFHVKISRNHTKPVPVLIGAEFEFKSSSPALLLLLPTGRRRNLGPPVEMAMDLSTSSSSAPSSLILTSGASGRISALFSLRALRSLMMLINAFFLFLLLPFRGRKRPAPSSSADKLSDLDEKQRGPVVRVPPTIVHWKSSSSAPPPVDYDVAARRALAKIRVIQDDDENSVRQFSLFATARGNETLFTQTWTPVSVNIRFHFTLHQLFIFFFLNLGFSILFYFSVELN